MAAPLGMQHDSRTTAREPRRRSFAPPSAQFMPRHATLAAAYGPFCTRASASMRAASGIAFATGIGGLMWLGLLVLMHGIG